MPIVEKIRTSIYTVRHRYFYALLTASALALAKDVDGVRNVLPEPFDLFDHAGNIGASMQFGFLAGVGAGLLANRGKTRLDNTDEASSVGSLRSKMALGGLAMGVIMNGLTETKWGMKLVSIENTPDPIDFVYGAAAATLAAAYIPTIDQEMSYGHWVEDSEQPESFDLDN